MSKVKWLYQYDPPEYDAVGKTHGGCCCEVVHNHKNKWSIYVDEKYIGECDTKELGKKACEEYVAKF